MGYKLVERRIVYCDRDDLIDSGLRSEDVLRHELFHAMYCQLRPADCTLEMARDAQGFTIALHEGFADWFAHGFAPDACFGEEFYSERACVRPYQGDACYSLVTGGHARGQTIAALLVREKVALEAYRPYFEDPALPPDYVRDRLAELDSCFAQAGAPLIDIVSDTHEVMRSNRFYLDQERPVARIRFEPNRAYDARYRELRVRFRAAKGDEIQKVAIVEKDGEYEVRARAGASGFEKVIATYFAGGREIGFKPFYFRIK